MFIKVHIALRHPLMIMTDCDIHQILHHISTFLNGNVILQDKYVSLIEMSHLHIKGSTSIIM